MEHETGGNFGHNNLVGDVRLQALAIRSAPFFIGKELVMTQIISPPLSLGELLTRYQAIRPGEIPTIRTVLKTIIFPALGYRKVLGTRLERLIEETPAPALYGLLDPVQHSWSEHVRRRLPEGTTHQKAYYRVLRRLLTFGEREGLLHPDQYAISPDWWELIERFISLTSDAGMRQDAGRLRSGLRILARWATSRGYEPRDLPLEVRANSRIMGDFHRTFPPERDGAFYLARRAWNLLADSLPDTNLARWISEGERRFHGIPRSNWPPCVALGLESLIAQDGLGMWRPETVAGYQYLVSTYLGTLRDLGLDAKAFLVGVDDGTDALRLLFQGMPPETRAIDANESANRLSENDSYREGLLSALRGMSGQYDGRASQPNPFIIAAIASLVRDGKVATASHLLTRALAISRGVLGITERHVEWCLKMLRQINQLSKRQPTRYYYKKRAVFRYPELWADLVRARSRLREHTVHLGERAQEAVGSQQVQYELRWAVALRNEVLFSMLLCYPLRAGNFSQMLLGIHFDARRHRIHFRPEETKNQREIEYELPESGDGSLGDIRTLVQEYLDVARPLLLAGRESPYFFVPSPNGGMKLARQAFNTILREISRRFLAGVLPDGLEVLNPHLLRHAAASYQLAVRENLNLAAQILNDSPSTISKSYADVLENKTAATKRFLSGFKA